MTDRNSVTLSISKTKSGWQWSVTSTDKSYGSGSCTMPGDAAKKAANKLAIWAAVATRRIENDW